MLEGGEGTAADRLELLDWKRRVFELYTRVRAAPDPVEAWDDWRRTRDELFRHHPSSPLPPDRRAGFGRLDYFPYDPRLRLLAQVVSTDATPVTIGTSSEEPVTGVRFAQARFELEGAPRTLDLYWLSGYGGGLLLAFADRTSGPETYGGGRYLLDTIKGSDLGGTERELVLDFNFAYNPSCCYDPRWRCPLAPPANRLAAPVRAGERLPGTAA